MNFIIQMVVTDRFHCIYPRIFKWFPWKRKLTHWKVKEWVLSCTEFSPEFLLLFGGGWGCEVSCGGHHWQRGKATTGSALDGAVFDIAQILAYLVHNLSRSQLYLGLQLIVSATWVICSVLVVAVWLLPLLDAGVPGVSFEKTFLFSHPSLCLSTWGVVYLALM